MMTTTCPACDGTAMSSFYAVSGVPVNSCLLLQDEAAARTFPRGALQLAICSDCAFISNTAFDPAQITYSHDYEETQGFSPHFREYMADLAKQWVARYSLTSKTVIEIGCGKGEFLVEMLRVGAGHGVGIDPGLHMDRIDAEVRERGTWVTGVFPDNYPVLDAEAVVCRHTLEHLAPVGAWMRSVRAAIGERTDTIVLVEVPDVLRVLEEGAFWDVYYEHCSYFSAGSLEALFRRAGFEPVDIRRTFGDQYLVIESRPTDEPGLPVVHDRSAVLAAAEQFAAAQRELASHWRARVRDENRSGGRTVVWGASSKAVGFLTVLGDEAGNVAAAVDINPHKQGSFLAGTGHVVAAPEQLAEVRPTLVIAMNPAYVDEIRSDLSAQGLTASLETL